VDAGDRNDVIVLGALAGVELVEVLAGRGNDAVVGREGADLLYGGAGRDWLGGMGGGDRLDGGSGDDALDGGDGRDLVTYATRRAGVAVDLAAGTGGAAGESDRMVRVEDAAGGRGSDRLYGDAGENYLYGGGAGRDVADGRDGNDRLNARRAIGGRGDDGLDARFADCGGGSDVASRFGYRPPGSYRAECEQIAGYYYVITRPRRVRGGLRVTLSCPIRRCSGRFTVRDRRGVVAERRYAQRGEEFGGPPPQALTLRFSRRPAGAAGRFEVSVPSLRRDHFRVGLR
jgi:Ca2+-binding RTX toxin-like protein